VADTFVQQTDGAGTKIHVFARTVSGQTVAEEVHVPGVSGYATARGTLSGSAGGVNFPIPQLQAGPYFPIISMYRVHFPAPYYYYVSQVTARQSGTPLGTAEVLSLTVGLSTNGFGDGWVFGGTAQPAAAIVPMSDTADGITGYSIFTGSVERTSGPLIPFGLAIPLTVPCVGTGALPTSANADRWEARAKPLRAGPGDALSIGLWQTYAFSLSTTIQVMVELECSID